jgi:hypothetical protein
MKVLDLSDDQVDEYLSLMEKKPYYEREKLLDIDKSRISHKK